ncbi:CMP-N-acetylneuraminate-beta-galactosamide-alpha-2,3-sialyltransferase 1-like, partial [Gouania willdenowi]|uniref:CMP-N-acetylneuraminate-beta-galactosamide- alpha-2,3-sialyltransferase 1-like n=1 Tax=Gouania willdenowi TaxID=441366 RepID=UPI0010557587
MCDKGLQRERGNFTVYNTTLDSLFQIFSSPQDVAGHNPGRCLSCAVVGNSGSLKKSHYGPLIDLHDVVMRINRGQTKGFEADVGSKTTHHIFYPESAKKLDNSTQLVFVPFKIADLKWLFKKFNSQKRSAVDSMISNKDLVRILNPAFIKYVHEEWLDKKGRYPSTGFLILALSMQICDQVDVFGFGADQNGNWHHYFEKKTSLKTGPHAGLHEYETIERLDQKEKIK